MKGFVGVTDNDWFAFLSQHQGTDEVNFWQPSADVSFRARHSATKMADKKNGGQARQQGEFFLFKLLNARSTQAAH
jgi:hypothetical protein